MPETARSEAMDVSAFLGVLRRRFAIIFIAVAVTAGAAYFISKSQEKEYSATTDLLLQGVPPTQPGAEFAPPNPETAPDRESLVLSSDVLERAQRLLATRVGESRARQLVGDVTAFSAQDSALVELTGTADAPEAAALAANTLAEANIASRRAYTLRRLRRAEGAARRELDDLGVGPDASAAVPTLTNELADLRRGIETADGDAEIVNRAGPPSSPSSPKPNRNAIIGAFGGLLLGLALALGREQMDRRMRNPKQLEETFGLPVLASVPRSRALAASNGRALDPLPAQEAEAFQILRANLRFLNTERELRSVVVTSAGVGDGKSTVALNLAKADAAIGKKVLLVEADLRRPRLANLLGIGTGEGLTAYLADGSRPLAEVTHRVPVVQRHNGGAEGMLTMDVVVAGPVPANPSELINSARMRQLISDAERDYDLVVLDTPPAAIVADSIPLMSEATAVVIVGRVGKVTSGEANNLREQLERIDAPAFGLVANFSGGPGKYGYGYY